MGLSAVKRELGTEAIKSVLLSFTRAASGCEGPSFGPDVTRLIEHQPARRQDEHALCSGPVLILLAQDKHNAAVSNTHRLCPSR